MSSSTTSSTTSTPEVKSVDCVGTWTNCTKVCGGDGTRTFNITTPKQGNGTACEAEDKEESNCNIPCTEPCKAGYTADGNKCKRHSHIYGKGCCCIYGSCCSPSGKCPTDYIEDPCTCRLDAHEYDRTY